MEGMVWDYIFAHQYFNLNIASTWDTLTKDVPALKEGCMDIYEIISKDE